MRYLLKMAIRNLRRNRRRSMLALTSVGLSVMLCVIMQGFLGGFLGSMVKNYTKNDTGHIRITTEGFVSRSEFLPVDENLNDPAAIEKKIKDDPAVADRIALMTERINFGVLLENEGLNKGAMALAGDPKTEKQLLYLQRSIEKGGRYIEGAGETIVGAGLAKDLHLSLGNSLKVVTTASDGSLQLKKFRIVGIFKTGIESFDDRVFQIPIGDAKQFLRTGGGVQQIIIMLKDYRNADRVAAQISSLLGDSSISVEPWTAIGSFPAYFRLASTMYNYIYVVVLLLGAFIITNIMMMVVLERRKEIGILKAMGFSRHEILGLFVWEGIFLGVLGSLFGAAAGMAVNLLTQIRGVNTSAFSGTIDFPMDNIIYFQINIPVALGIVALGAVIAGVMSLLPSRRAARMNVVDAIKSV